MYNVIVSPPHSPIRIYSYERHGLKSIYRCCRILGYICIFVLFTRIDFERHSESFNIARMKFIPYTFMEFIILILLNYLI